MWSGADLAMSQVLMTLSEGVEILRNFGLTGSAKNLFRRLWQGVGRYVAHDRAAGRFRSRSLSLSCRERATFTGGVGRKC